MRDSLLKRANRRQARQAVNLPCKAGSYPTRQAKLLPQRKGSCRPSMQTRQTIIQPSKEGCHPTRQGRLLITQARQTIILPSRAGWHPTRQGRLLITQARQTIILPSRAGCNHTRQDRQGKISCCSPNYRLEVPSVSLLVVPKNSY